MKTSEVAFKNPRFVVSFATKSRRKKSFFCWYRATLYRQISYKFKSKRKCCLSRSCYAFKFYTNVLALSHWLQAFVCRAVSCMHNVRWARWTKQKIENPYEVERSVVPSYDALPVTMEETQKPETTSTSWSRAKFVNFWPRACVLGLWLVFVERSVSAIQLWHHTAVIFLGGRICLVWNMVRLRIRAFDAWNQNVIFKRLK